MYKGKKQERTGSVCSRAKSLVEKKYRIPSEERLLERTMSQETLDANQRIQTSFSVSESF